ncbi:MAG: MFS transporter [Pseudomonadales bacterium]|jgi:Na+/melibiose symporter-like transporter|nr:MFS transporter [Pseudomonadales bacterium]MDP7594059.1 MFS transporter [Pseudomonadales bacterium]HJN53147.1 MFS transporter [Pseudomonadales bacterium]|tara:strand:- start:1788 stop:3230 length:1443 start_codon:yes stop_codon:yes gene_type:complete
MAQSDSLAMRTKLAFGIGATGEASTNWIFNALTFFYYNQILGLSGTMTALAVTIGIASDAITDPLMGSISDRYRSRFGRRHPFMFAAPAPLVLTIYAIFNPPGGLDSTGLFLWFAIFTVGMRICLTLFAVPHLAMGAELSDDYNERSKVMSYNNVFTYLGVFVMHVVVWWVIFPAFDNGRTNQDSYLPIVFFCCSLIMVSILTSAYTTLDQLPRMKKIPEDLPPFSFLQLFREMWSAISNRHYLFLLLGFFFLAVTIGTHETLGLYMGTFYWEFTDYQMGWLIMSNVFGYTLGFMGAARLHSWIDKRASIVLTAAGLSVFWSMAVTLRLFDLAPANTTWQLVTFVIFWGTFSSACGSILNISVMSALADIADEHELKTGRRQEGIFYSARTFFAKSTNGVGHIVAGIALDAIEFPTGAVPGSVDADKIFALGVIDGPFAMVWGLVAACFYAGYRINRKYHEDIQRQLAERAAASQAQEKP